MSVNAASGSMNETDKLFVILEFHGDEKMRERAGMRLVGMKADSTNHISTLLGMSRNSRNPEKVRIESGLLAVNLCVQGGHINHLWELLYHGEEVPVEVATKAGLGLVEFHVKNGDLSRLNAIRSNKDKYGAREAAEAGYEAAGLNLVARLALDKSDLSVGELIGLYRNIYLSEKVRNAANDALAVKAEAFAKELRLANPVAGDGVTSDAAQFTRVRRGRPPKGGVPTAGTKTLLPR